MLKTFSSLKAETVNSFTHALGVLFGLIFIPLLIIRSAKQENTAQLTGVMLYGFFFLATFTLSTLYHAFNQPKLKTGLRLLDHISIYFFIAATYTPFVIYFMFNRRGILLLLAVWLFALAGSVFKTYLRNRLPVVSVILYVLTGLLFLAVRKHFFSDMPEPVIQFIYYGVGLYLLGLIFFLWRKWKHHHALWHLFVLGGGICHFKAVWLSVAAFSGR